MGRQPGTKGKMKPRAAKTLICLMATALAASLVIGQIRHTNINLAEARFRLGDFNRAEEITTFLLQKDPDNLRAILLQAKLALLRNQLADAESEARRALGIRSDYRPSIQILAEVHYRRGEFASAALLQATLGRRATAAKLASFAGDRPYEADSIRAKISFAEIDPLPIINVSVNGSASVPFLFDTGVGEVGVDIEWATETGVVDFGLEKTPGGETRAHGRVDRLDLGGFEIRNVPVALLRESLPVTTRSGKPVRGVIGATLMSRFQVTIDYPDGRLIFAPRNPVAPETDDPTLVTHVPFYFTVGNNLIARGQVNDSDPILLLIATGQASLGFTSPRRTLDEAAVELLEETSDASSPIPYLLESLSLGKLRRTQVPGVHGLFPASLEHDQGFQLGGLIANGFLRPYVVTFDFDAMELLIR